MSKETRTKVPEVSRVVNAVTGEGQELSQNPLLPVLKMAYQKHALNDDSVGWDELTDELCNALCEVMGDKGFQDWLDEVAS